MPIEPEKPGEVSKEQQEVAETFFKADHSRDIVMTPEEWEAFASLISPNGIVINSSDSSVIVKKRSSVLK